jgi:membrane peptidoglycan carboxypeptidase
MVSSRYMQTALQRRQRHRRNGAARRGRGGGAARRAALAIPLILFSSFLVLGGVGFVGTVSAYSYYSQDLPDPKDMFNDLGFEQPSIVYDRTGTVELARFGVLRRELIEFQDIPAEMMDATTAVEDKDFWTNPGFDMGAVVSAGLDTIAGRPRGASTITQQLVRARLLEPQHFEGTVYDRKIREIIQSIRLTQAFPGEQGKRDIMTAYLNQNFYGNQSYGVKAASLGYFGKQLDELTLAQYAVLAAIPQSPTKFDLMRNAVNECEVEVEEDEECPGDKIQLVVPDTTEIMERRNFVLDQMAKPGRMVLSGDEHTVAELEAAKREPLILTPQETPPRKAPHFVDRIREQLGALLCGPENAESCEAVDTGGYKVITSLDWEMQQTVEKWLYASTRVTHLKSPGPVWEDLGIPKSELGWLRDLRDANIHNGAAAIMDYRTGQVLAYGGSGGYYLDGTKKFQPQFDVLSNGFRQPGSAIKPLNYIIGLDDHTMTAATMFMDVVTDFGGRNSSYLPTQADGLERGPTRLRPALQFSFNIPAIKAGLINGIEHAFNRQKEFGLTYPDGAVPVVSQSVGSIETHPIDLVGAYGAIANGGELMPRTMIIEVKDKDGVKFYPTETNAAPEGKRVATPQASYIISDILAGNTVKSVNPIWARWQIIEKDSDGNVRRPAAYKTGTTNDRKDTHAYGYLAPPKDPNAPGLVVGVWMGNSNSTPNTDALSLASSGPLWSRILTEVSQNLPIAKFERPDGLVEKEVDAFSGLLPGPGTVETVKELFIKGTEPTRRDDLHVSVQIDGATGLLWQEGCTGPVQTRMFLDFSGAEPRFEEWQRYTQGWAQRAARGVGVRGGPKKTRTMYFYNLSFHPFGATWGGRFKPTKVCSAQPQACPPEGQPTPDASGNVVPCFTPEPTDPGKTNGPPTDDPDPTPTKPGNPKPTPKPTPTKAPASNAPTAARSIPDDAGLAPAAMFPLLVPFAGLAIAQRLKPKRPHRTKRRR